LQKALSGTAGKSLLLFETVVLSSCSTLVSGVFSTKGKPILSAGI